MVRIRQPGTAGSATGKSPADSSTRIPIRQEVSRKTRQMLGKLRKRKFPSKSAGFSSKSGKFTVNPTGQMNIN